ncbi:MAG: hypothetical protein DRO88_10260 [Promethearchaeia archaeon]|nr:MAG: hypothetical protein DRO88_10260 [Candidatus Lokiarchaeia archaeon]
MLEVEVKIKIRGEDEVRRKLKELGAKPSVHLHHIDKYFDSLHPNRSFALSDEALRLRISEEFPIAQRNAEMGSTPQNHYANIASEAIKRIDLTYKGPKESGVVKSRKEIICNLDNSEAMEKILTSIGFFLRCIIDKHRDVFKIQYSSSIEVPIEVLVDHVEGLSGAYLEAEIMVPSTMEEIDKTNNAVMDKDRATEILLDFIGKLGYSASDSITKSYLEMVLEKELNH